MNVSDFITSNLVTYLKGKINTLGIKAEVIEFPEIKDNWRFEHPNASIVVNIGDLQPKEELIYGQNIDIEIEISFYSRTYKGKEGIRNIVWSVYPLIRNFQLPTNDDITQNDSLRWADSFRPPLSEEEAREYNLEIHKYIIPVIYG